jgi:hypothetical protein
MTVIKKADLGLSISLPKETVQVDELGGEVIVQGLKLSERFELFGEKNAETRSGRVLAVCVRDADGEPLMTMEEWEIWGATHFDAAARLVGKAMDLSGFNKAAAEKNSEATQS